MGKASRAKREARTGESVGVVVQEPSVDAVLFQTGLAELAVAKRRQQEHLRRLTELLQIRERADRDARTLVSALRAAGVPWSAIGRATKLSRQGAARRFGQVKRA
jgi:hypothetical protein